jgi:YggT family protein
VPVIQVVAVLHFIIFLFFVVLIGRLVIETIQGFAREWQPRGVVLVIAETIYTATDPPLKLLRRLLPPLRVGQVQFDLAMIVLFLIVTFALLLTNG